MKILHIGNTAGVGSVIAKHMYKLFSSESLVLHTWASDPYGFTTYGELWDCRVLHEVLFSIVWLCFGGRYGGWNG